MTLPRIAAAGRIGEIQAYGFVGNGVEPAIVTAWPDRAVPEFLVPPLNEQLVIPIDTFPTLYDDLLAQGSQSAIDALEVGRYIEQTDATDLREAMDDVAGTQLARVYGNLLDGSLNHLDAFDALLG